MLLTGHKTRAIFDRYNIINEQELLEAGDQLVAYLAQHAQATPRGGRPHPARTAAPRPRRPFASCDAPPRKGAHPTPPDPGPLRQTRPACAPQIASRPPPYGLARDRGTRGDGASRRGRTRARA